MNQISICRSKHWSDQDNTLAVTIVFIVLIENKDRSFEIELYLQFEYV